MVKLGMMKEASQKDHILIIEDSAATRILLKNFLSNMGYLNIHICDDGKSAITVFKQLVDSGQKPIVLLDYVLPDMDGHAIMTQLLEIKPDVKVILVTATEKTDVGVTELIRQGLYQYLEKPIRFENLKKIIQTLEDEKQFFKKEEALSDVLKKAEDLYQQIDFLLKSHKQISQAKIEEYVDAKGEQVSEHLDNLESKGKIIKLEDKREIACPQCNSVSIVHVFYCPSCKSSDFRLTKLLEHYPCGNISEEAKYKNDKCPSCKKELKALGVDYRVMENHYVCNDCDDVFSEISQHYICLKCENKFKQEEARWHSSPYYKTTNI